MDKKKRYSRKMNHFTNDKQINYYRGNDRLFPTSINYRDNDEYMFSEYDPFGSYTGVSENEFDRPIQDADDL